MKKCYVLVWTVLEKYYFDYQGREVVLSKLKKRWRKDGGNFVYVEESGRKIWREIWRKKCKHSEVKMKKIFRLVYF